MSEKVVNFWSEWVWAKEVLEYIKDLKKEEEKFEKWSELKASLNLRDEIPYFREWQVWFINMWLNIWFEQNWKNENFQRPILIVKKFNKNMILWIPLTKTKRFWKFYKELDIVEEFKSYAILSQIKMYSSNRLLSHIWWISLLELKDIKKKINTLIT